MNLLLGVCWPSLVLVLGARSSERVSNLESDFAGKEGEAGSREADKITWSFMMYITVW